MDFTSRPHEALSEEIELEISTFPARTLSATRSGCRSYKIRGRQKRKRTLAAPFLRFSAVYFGTGSDAKFAWTNTQLLSFFTKTRVDFARPGSVFPSLPMVRPI